MYELDEDGRNEKLIEERILRQAEATSILSGIKEKLAEPLKKADRSRGVEEILADLEVDCEEEGGSVGVVESFRTTTVSTGIASTIKNGDNLAAAAEFLALLYSL